LHTEVLITLKEAILGFNKEIKHLDDHYTPISSKRNQIVQPFQVNRIRGEGMPQHQYAVDSGDLFVKFKVQLPSQLTTADRELLTKIF
jgi:DnaJ-class molecular chaperone